jgi:hypothetical protein
MQWFIHFTSLVFDRHTIGAVLKQTCKVDIIFLWRLIEILQASRIFGWNNVDLQLDAMVHSFCFASLVFDRHTIGAAKNVIYLVTFCPF